MGLKTKRNTLIHDDWEEHKYIAKVKIKDDYWRYFYDKEEYANFLKKRETDGIIKGMSESDNGISSFLPKSIISSADSFLNF